jgi:hypothetical protein
MYVELNPRKSQEPPGTSRRLHSGKDVVANCHHVQKLPGVPRSFQEPPGASRSLLAEREKFCRAGKALQSGRSFAEREKQCLKS